MSNERDIQKDILSAAARVFIAKGKSGARMQEIADEAGVNKMLLHYYFKSKDSLFQEVLQNTLVELYYSVIEISFQADSFKDSLRIFIDKHFEFLYKQKNVLSFLFWEVKDDGKVMREIIIKTFQRLGNTPMAAITEKVNKAINDGEIKKIDSKDFIMNLFSLNVFYCMILPFIQMFTDIDEKEALLLLESRKKEVLRLLWNDIKPD